MLEVTQALVLHAGGLLSSTFSRNHGSSANGCSYLKGNDPIGDRPICS